MKRIQIARLAGVFYFFNVILSIIYMEYVPSEIYITNDVSGTWSNLLSNESLFRIGIVAGILVHLSFILLPLTLYKLLGHVNKKVAILMVVLALISVPISYTLLIEQVNILDYLRSHTSMSIEDLSKVQNEVSKFYHNLYNGFFVNQFFWGLWLFPFGYLVFKSGFIPKTLGVFLMLGCIVYLIDLFGAVIFKNYYDFIDTGILIIPAAIGEIGSCLWLLIIGVRQGVKF